MRVVRAALTALALVAFAPASAHAVDIRVAIAKGATLSVKGIDLVAKDAAGRPVPLPDAYAEVPV